jgi:ubiquinone biosynthesis protein
MAKSNMFSQSKKDLNRIGHIFGILIKFQAGTYVNKILHKEKLPVHISRYKSPPEINRMNPPERTALMFEELGTSFVKFGQLLATRDDLIGPDYAAELSKLHDDMESFPTEEAKRIIKEELGRPVGEIFSSFENEPMASASIAQVHRATLKNGKKVVVKVQRPGIEETIKEDVRIMHYLAYLVDKNIPESHRYDPQYLVDEFERSIIGELDFLREVRNQERLKENFKDDKGIYVPIVYNDLCTKRVLTMEEIKGAKLTEIISSNSKKIDKKLIAKRCLQAYFHMILIDGFYHADPHPGNIMIINHDVICFLDFGRCATIDKDLADSIFQLVLFAINNDANGLISHLFRTGLIEEGVDTKSLKADLTALLNSYYSPNIKNVKIGQMLSNLMSIISKYDFNRPTELADLTRTLLILEGMGTQLDPDFNIAEEFRPYANKYLVQSFDLNKMADVVKSNLLDFQYIAKDFPSAFRRFMKAVSQGKITLQLEHKNLDIITANMKNMSDRVSVALILAALIIGSSAIGQINKTLGLFFFILSSALGVWLVLKTLVF